MTALWNLDDLPDGTTPVREVEVCGATWTTQRGQVDVCSREPGHDEIAHRGRIAEWVRERS